jgi:UDP-glucose 4-epimerase
MNIFVVGGAGYIGSHMVKRVEQLGCSMTTLDNLSSGRRDAVLHFASFIQVGKSMQQPAKYYENNVTNTLHPFDATLARQLLGWEQHRP